MKKLCVVITARASFARILAVLRVLDKRSLYDVPVILSAFATHEKTGHLGERLKKFKTFKTLEVNNVVDGPLNRAMPKTVALSILDLNSIFNVEKPDAIISVADRFETIATSICGALLGIPIVHFQGGEETGSIDNKIRYANSFLSDYHLVSNQCSFNKLVSLGIKKENIFNTGCPSLDIINKRNLINKSDIFQIIITLATALLSLRKSLIAFIYYTRIQTTILATPIIRVRFSMFWLNRTCKLLHSGLTATEEH